MPDPGACCVPDPTSEFRGWDRPARGCEQWIRCRRRAKSARASELRSRVYTVETGALSTLAASSTAAARSAGGSGGRPLNWADALGGGGRTCCSSRPHRQAPTTSDWPGRCGPGRPWCAASTRRRPTGTAATAASTWPAPSISRCTPRGRRRWCSPGVLAGRPVVSLAHPGGLRTSYEPVRAAVRVGQLVDSTTAIGHAWSPAIPAARPLPACTGARCGAPAARADYVDPLGLLASTRIRLKPLHPVVRASARVTF